MAAGDLPDRTLRRRPYAHEVTAAVDFAALDRQHDDTAGDLMDLFHGTLLPGYMTDVRDQITTTVRGTERQRILRGDLARRITASPAGVDNLTERLMATAMQGAADALDEVTAQGGAAALDEAAIRSVIADQADAVAQLWADGVTLASKRRAVQLVGSGTAQEIADATVSYVNGLAHQWEADQAAGMAQAAINAGRFHIFDQVQGTKTLYASELLDMNTCEFCRAVDGREYATMAEAQRDYPTGGFRSCAGGPRCRGSIVVVLASDT